MENWDLIIVGAGAGGLSAGIYGARSGLKTLIIEKSWLEEQLLMPLWWRIIPVFHRFWS